MPPSPAAGWQPSSAQLTVRDLARPSGVRCRRRLRFAPRRRSHQLPNPEECGILPVSFFLESNGSLEVILKATGCAALPNAGREPVLLVVGSRSLSQQPARAVSARKEVLTRPTFDETSTT